ncbi:MAG: FAD-binding oxidoreductase [Euryarchaeota archaeon]|nr:FAD-binding oxidoreductase [Euryarchaeota archaeon]
MKARTRVAIIGAGIVGLMTALHLARRGVTDVVVLDRAPALLLGASGRNGGGIRAQWTTAENIELAKRSIEQFERLARDTGHNTWFRQGGYLFLARTEEQLSNLRKAAAFQNAHGVRTRLVDADGARRIVPPLSTEGILGGAFNPDDGTLFPWPVVHGVAEEVRRRGVEIVLNADVVGFDTAGGKVRAVVTSRGRVEADHVLLAAGARSPSVAALLGIDLPTRPQRHEILVTEALKPFFDPMLVDLSNGLYASQAMRGEVIGGVSHPHVDGHSQESSLAFASTFARALTRLLPQLTGVRALRQWAGSYDLTPDARPILGLAGAFDNFYVACGFTGHGFMIAPMTGQLLAELMTGGKPSLPIDGFRLSRFAEGDLAKESMVIG